MANYAPLGNAVFGITVFGTPPIVSAYTNISVTPIDYNALEVNWTPVPGVIGQVLVRSAYGIPVSETDGTVLLSEGESATPYFSAQYVDTDLQAGRFYYYALFVTLVEQATPQILASTLAGSAQGLVLTDWGFGQTFQSWTPDFYMWLDGDLATTAQPEGPLERFLNLLGYEMDWMRSEIETMTTLTSADYISGALLPDLGATYGVTYEPELGMTRSRVLVKNAVALYKQRGTPGGIAAAASAFSGFGAKTSFGNNLEIQLDDSAFDLSVGHWVPGNTATSLKTIPASMYGVTPPHTAYQPIQGNPTATSLNTALDVEGYLPVNNENVLEFTSLSTALEWTQTFPATSPETGVQTFIASSPTTILLYSGYSLGSYSSQTWTFNGTSWTQHSPATSPPGRLDPVLAYDPASSTWILQSGSNATSVLNDTWSWNGTTWTELFPATSPPAGQPGGMVYDSANNVMILWNTNSFGNDTWSWNGTTWTELFPATSPPGRYGCAMGYDGATGTIIMFGGYTDINGTFTNYGDTWSWNGTTWTELFPATSPPARYWQTEAPIVYDASAGVMLLFGGFTLGTPNTLWDDTWSWNGTTWTELTYSVNPPASPWVLMAYLASESGIFYFQIGYSSWFWGSVGTVPVQITTCTAANAQNLGIPVVPLTNDYTVSAYFMPVQQTTPTLRSFEMQMDWYGLSGNFISSTTGSSVTEIADTWVRAYVTGTPPAGAYTFGRTVKSTGALSGDLHLMDAELVQINASLIAWEPPRDIKINLFPLRQNLMPNPGALGGTYGVVNTQSGGGGTLSVSTSLTLPWPSGISAGWLVGANTTSGNFGFDFNTPIALEAVSTATTTAFYTVSVYMMPGTGASARTFEFEVTFNNGTQFIGSLTETLGQFNRGSIIDIAAPVGATTMNVGVFASALTTGEKHYVTGYLIESSPALGPYFDANGEDTTDYFWEGTPNESASDYYPNLEIKLARLVEAMPEYIPIGSTFSLVTGPSAFSNVSDIL
jgi:hypothetical protein